MQPNQWHKLQVIAYPIFFFWKPGIVHKNKTRQEVLLAQRCYCPCWNPPSSVEWCETQDGSETDLLYISGKWKIPSTDLRSIFFFCSCIQGQCLLGLLKMVSLILKKKLFEKELQLTTTLTHWFEIVKDDSFEKWNCLPVPWQTYS